MHCHRLKLDDYMIYANVNENDSLHSALFRKLMSHHCNFLILQLLDHKKQVFVQHIGCAQLFFLVPLNALLTFMVRMASFSLLGRIEQQSRR